MNRQFPDGVRDRALNLMANNGCQPTSLAFMRACAAMGIRQTFTSYNNPKGNADTERFLHLKEELVWLASGPAPAPSSPPSIAGLVSQRQLPPFGARLSSAQCRRSRASRPRHSLSRGLLNGVQYRLRTRAFRLLAARPPPLQGTPPSEVILGV